MKHLARLLMKTFLVTAFGFFFAEPAPSTPQSQVGPYPVGTVTPGGPGTQVKGSPAVYDASGTITQTNGTVILRGSGVLAMKLAAPGAGAQSPNVGGSDGSELTIISATAFAHTVTAPSGTLLDGSATAKDVATFPAHPGAILSLFAFGGNWYVKAGSTSAPAVLTAV